MNNVRSSQAGTKNRSAINGSGQVEAPIAQASADKTKKVKLVYYGGGLTLQNRPACPACGGGGKYALTTAETIMFPSEDVPGGMYKQYVQVGRSYYVTEKQAEYMLKLTFRNQAGQIINKFKKVED